MKKVLFFGFLCSVYIGFSQVKTEPISEFSQKANDDGVLVDVRTPEEFQQGHLDNAVNINFFDADFAKRFEGIDKKKTIYVYCKKGGRSIKAAKVLDSLGYTNVVDLEGGYDTFMKK